MISVKINNLDRLISMANKSPAIAEKHVNLAISRSLVRILGQEKVTAPVGVTGHLRDNWELKTGRFTGLLRSKTPYALAVHEGTGPHRVSVEQLKPWARNKGLNPWAVAASIRRKGTKANPFFKRTLTDVLPDVEREFQKAVQNLLVELATTF